MYKAVLFDLDGTLTDSGEGITRSVQYALEKMGRPEENLTALRCFVGPPLKEQFMDYAGLSEEEGVQAVAFYRERYKNIGIFENALYPGVPQMLQKLQQEGYLLGVASSKPTVFVNRILEHFQIAPYFQCVVGSEMDGTRTRKSEVILEALRQLHFEEKRESVLMVGDREHDILGARELGLDCVAVSYGYAKNRGELEQAKPLAIADSVEELRDFFY